jgi:integrase
MAESTKNNKAMRWRIYIEPEWGDYPVSQVTRRAAQDWITEVEGQIANGELGTFGLPHFQKVRSDLHTLFESMATFSSTYEDRNNPFAGLDFTPPPPRAKVTMESQFFGGLAAACRHFVAEELCTGWIAEMFLTSLFAGLREGEVMALCRDQLDFKNGAIVIDRALRRDSRAIDPKTRLEFGAVVPQAMNLPKGGSPTRNKTRVVPMSDQLAEILEKVFERRGALNSEWDLLWPSQKGDMRALGRFRHAWGTLRARLHEVAIYAPLVHEGGKWPEVPKRQGWPRNSYIDVARADAQRRLPDIFANIDFRDTRNSFASYMNELDLSQATREHILGHGGGLTNTVYTVITSAAHQNARQRITNGWAVVVNDSISKQAVVVVP